jgi:uncharacterized protein (TIGR03437 family)
MLRAAFLLCATCAAQTPLTITAVTNAADLRPGFPQRGSLASVFLTGLQGQGTIVSSQNPLPNQIDGISVSVNFVPAPIVSISFQPAVQQINFQVPWEGDRDPLYLEVFQNGNRAAFQGPYTNNGFELITENWSVLFVDATGHALVQHAADYSPVTPQNPAVRGEYLIAYGINLGPVTIQPQTGYASPANPPSVFYIGPLGTPYACHDYDEVLVGSSAAPAMFDGLSPGLVGVYQMNFQVPSTAPSGEVPLAIYREIDGVFGPSCNGPGPPITTKATSFSALISVQ